MDKQRDQWEARVRITSEEEALAALEEETKRKDRSGWPVTALRWRQFAWAFLDAVERDDPSAAMRLGREFAVRWLDMIPAGSKGPIFLDSAGEMRLI